MLEQAQRVRSAVSPARLLPFVFARVAVSAATPLPRIASLTEHCSDKRAHERAKRGTIVRGNRRANGPPQVPYRFARVAPIPGDTMSKKTALLRAARPDLAARCTHRRRPPGGGGALMPVIPSRSACARRTAMRMWCAPTTEEEGVALWRHGERGVLLMQSSARATASTCCRWRRRSSLPDAGDHARDHGEFNPPRCRMGNNTSARWKRWARIVARRHRRRSAECVRRIAPGLQTPATRWKPC